MSEMKKEGKAIREAKKECKEVKTKQSVKQVWRNNLFLIKLCASASPMYIFVVTFEAARNQLSIFLEHTYGIGYILEAAEFHYPFRDVAIFVLALAAFVTAEMILAAYLNNYWAVRELPKVRRKVKMMLYEKAKDLDLECYDNPDYYNELMLVITEADKQIERCVTFLRNTASGFVAFISVGAYFLLKDGYSVIFAAISFILAFLFNQLFNKLSFKVKMERYPFERKREYIKRVFYMSDYAKELRLNPRVSEILYEDFEDASSEIYRVEKSYARKRFCLSFLRRYLSNDFFSDIIYVLYLVYRAAVTHALSFSSVAILYNSFGTLKRSMRVFTDVYPYASETSLYVQKILDFLDYEQKITSDKKRPVSKGAKALELKHVSFAYDKKKGDIIKDVSFSIAPGEKIALVGYNGAGKTTLTKLIMRLYDTTEGEILVDGINIKDYEVEQYRRSIGTVFQDFKIFAGTIAENVLMDLDDEAQHTKIQEALTHSGLSKRVEALPEGLMTPMTTEFEKTGVNLSGGENQKLAISRVFFKEAGLIILDEPSSALDPIAEYQLNHAMLEVTENKTVIFISHRLSTTRLADRIIMLEQGQIVEQGTHEELLLQNGKYAKMWKAQAGQYIEV